MLSRAAKIWILLVIDSAFLLVELVVGYAVGSLALVADSFHMLNDVMSLVVALYAIKVSANSPTSKYSYGWHRAEILAALINGVFLLALCLSIFLEAIVRFFETPVVSNPKLVVIVGSLGLCSNIIGLFLFHEHGHSHSHPQSPPTPTENRKPLIPDIEVSAIDADDDDDATPRASRVRSDSISSFTGHPAQTRAYVVQAAEQAGYGRRASGSFSRDEPHRLSRAFSPHSLGASESAGPIGNYGSTSETQRVDGDCQVVIDITEPDDHQGHNHGHDDAHGHDDEHSHSDDGHDHDDHEHGNHAASGGHGHSHGSMNMHGLLLHVMGDALGNIGVIASGLIIWLTNWPGKYYSDPIISLVITCIIFASALPLVKSASFILLQGVPTSISLDSLRERIRDVRGVLSLHELHVWQLSEAKIVASVHVWVGKNCDYMRVATEIREVLHDFGVHSCTIQPEVHPGREDGIDLISTEETCLIPCALGQVCPPDAACCPPPPSSSSGTDRLVDV